MRRVFLVEKFHVTRVIVYTYLHSNKPVKYTVFNSFPVSFKVEITEK